MCVKVDATSKAWRRKYERVVGAPVLRSVTAEVEAVRASQLAALNRLAASAQS